jgi:hypothetical protein
VDCGGFLVNLNMKFPQPASCIWRSIRKVSPMKYISFSRCRLSKKRMAKNIPKILRFHENFGPRTLKFWKKKMEQHNSILQRGILNRPHFDFKTARFEAQSLDTFLLQFNSESIADALECLLSFAKLAIPTIRKNPDSHIWWLNADIIVYRHHWLRLCRRVKKLLHILGFGAFAESKNFDITQLSILSGLWPGADRLCTSALQAQAVFSTYCEA